MRCQQTQAASLRAQNCRLTLVFTGRHCSVSSGGFCVAHSSKTDHSQGLKLSQGSGSLAKPPDFETLCFGVDPALGGLEERGKGVNSISHVTVKFEVSLASKNGLKSKFNIEDLTLATHQIGCKILTFAKSYRLRTRRGLLSYWDNGRRRFRCL